jgi:phage terminase small subunit
MLVSMVAAKVEEWAAIRAELDRLGSTTYVAPNGQTLTHPLVRQLNEAEVRLTSWLSALGCSPSDRSRLGPEVLARGTTDELTAFRLRNRLRDLSRPVVEEFG